MFDEASDLWKFESDITTKVDNKTQFIWIFYRENCI